MKYDYNIDISVTGTIDAQVAEQIIRDVIEGETGRKIKSLTMRVRSKTSGALGGGAITHEFDGVTIHFDGDRKTVTSTDTKVPFKADTYTYEK